MKRLWNCLPEFTGISDSTGYGSLIVFYQTVHKPVVIEFYLDKKVMIRQAFLVNNKVMQMSFIQ